MDIFSRDVPPTHPGVILAEALENMNLKIMPAASLLGTSRQTLHKIIRGDAPITPPMALKIRHALRQRSQPLDQHADQPRPVARSAQDAP